MFHCLTDELSWRRRLKICNSHISFSFEFSGLNIWLAIMLLCDFSQNCFVETIASPLKYDIKVLMILSCKWFGCATRCLPRACGRPDSLLGWWVGAGRQPSWFHLWVEVCRVFQGPAPALASALFYDYFPASSEKNFNFCEVIDLV